MPSSRRARQQRRPAHRRRARRPVPGAKVTTRAPLFPRPSATRAAPARRVARSSSMARAPTDTQLQQRRLTAGWELDCWGRVRGAERAAADADWRASEDAARRVDECSVAGRRRGIRLRCRSTTSSRPRAHAREPDGQRSTCVREALQGRRDLQGERRRRARNYDWHAAAVAARMQQRVHDREAALPCWYAPDPGPITRGATGLRRPADIPVGLPAGLLERRPDVRVGRASCTDRGQRPGHAGRALYFPSCRSD